MSHRVRDPEDDIAFNPVPPYSKELEARNRIAFAYMCAAATHLARQKGLTRYALAKAMNCGPDEIMTGADWKELEQEMIRMENGIDGSGLPVGYEVIMYATALGVQVRPEVQDWAIFESKNPTEESK